MIKLQNPFLQDQLLCKRLLRKVLYNICIGLLYLFAEPTTYSTMQSNTFLDNAMLGEGLIYLKYFYFMPSRRSHGARSIRTKLSSHQPRYPDNKIMQSIRLFPGSKLSESAPAIWLGKCVSTSISRRTGDGRSISEDFKSLCRSQAVSLQGRGRMCSCPKPAGHNCGELLPLPQSDHLTTAHHDLKSFENNLLLLVFLRPQVARTTTYCLSVI